MKKLILLTIIALLALTVKSQALYSSWAESFDISTLVANDTTLYSLGGKDVYLKGHTVVVGVEYTTLDDTCGIMIGETTFGYFNTLVDTFIMDPADTLVINGTFKRVSVPTKAEQTWIDPNAIYGYMPIKIIKMAASTGIINIKVLNYD